MSGGNRVVVGFDGGRNGEDALTFARRWAQASDDEVVVVTVHPGAAPVGPQRVDAEWAAYEREEAEHVLDKAEALLGTDVRTSYHRIDAGSASRGLHELVTADTEHTPLVVLGARRRASTHRTFPGTTADRLLHGTPVPVALVPLGYADEPEHRLSRVVLAYVDTPDGRVALDEAVRIAQHLGASLRVVSVVPDTLTVPALGEPGVFGADQRRDFATALDEAVAKAREAGVETEGELIEGVPHEVLADIDSDRGDLLVCGSRGYGPVRAVLLGGVSARVVRSAQLPVVMVPRGDS